MHQECFTSHKPVCSLVEYKHQLTFLQWPRDTLNPSSHTQYWLCGCGYSISASFSKSFRESSRGSKLFLSTRILADLAFHSTLGKGLASLAPIMQGPLKCCYIRTSNPVIDISPLFFQYASCAESWPSCGNVCGWGHCGQ